MSGFLFLLGLVMIGVGVSRMPGSWQEVVDRTNGPAQHDECGTPTFTTDWSMALIGPLVTGGLMALFFGFVLFVTGG